GVMPTPPSWPHRNQATFAIAISASIRPRAMSGARERVGAPSREGGGEEAAVRSGEGRAAELFTADLSQKRRAAGEPGDAIVPSNVVTGACEHMRRTSVPCHGCPVLLSCTLRPGGMGVSRDGVGIATAPSACRMPAGHRLMPRLAGNGPE